MRVNFCTHKFTDLRFSGNLMPVVNIQRSITLNEEGLLNSGDPSLIATGGDFQIDLALELSKMYGKNIRQGQNFKVKGIQTSLRPVGSGYDSGLAHSSVFSFVPTTKHSKTAWVQAYKLWAKQKRLFAGATGGYVNYDDLEFCYSSFYANGRTSSVRQSGLGDPNLDEMCLLGSSSDGVFALEDYYDSMRPVSPPSQYSWNNSTVKEAKYTDKFPLPREVYAAGQLSAAVSEAGEWPAVYLSAATATATIHEFPEAQNVLCGLIKCNTFVIADDVIGQTPDTAILEVAIFVESWKPLMAMKPRRTSTPRRYTRKFRGGRRSNRRRRNRR